MSWKELQEMRKKDRDRKKTKKSGFLEFSLFVTGFSPAGFGLS